MKIMGAIIAIIVIIVVVALVVFMFMGGGSNSRFVGTWAYDDPFSGMLVYKFNGDGSLEFGTDLGTMEIGTWRVSGNQLCMTITAESYGSTGEQCGSYSFSSDGSEMTLTMKGQSMTFTKQ